jgi:hypothetical protein
MGHALAEALEALKGEMDTFAASLKEFSLEAKVTSKSILKMIALIRSQAQARDDNVPARLLPLEAVVNEIDRPISPHMIQQRFNNLLGGNIPLGTAIMGGTETTITANMLFNLVQELQAKVDILLEQAKNTGIIFHDTAFNLESKYSVWLAFHNPSGAGCAAMVNFQSIWAFAESESQDSSAWLNNMEKSRKIGLRGGRFEASYMHSMGQKYPSAFVGKEKNITSTTTLKMLELIEQWQGNGMGGGYKASLTKALQAAIKQH